MTARARIVATLERFSTPVCDDCLKDSAKLSARQVAYAECTRLARDGRITRERDRCSRCGDTKLVSSVQGTPQDKIANETTIGENVQPSSDVLQPSDDATDMRRWHWEGNVQTRVVTWLARTGYDIVSAADTATRVRGKDIIAKHGDSGELWISVKGYPDKSPHLQARHWFGGAIFDLVLYRDESPNVNLAIALPDGFTTYRNLAARVSWLKRQLPFKIYWVAESGDVREE